MKEVTRVATERVTREELLDARQRLLDQLPVAARVRLLDIDHLLGWPPGSSEVECPQCSATIGATG
jgi:hypothetical protein